MPTDNRQQTQTRHTTKKPVTVPCLKKTRYTKRIAFLLLFCFPYSVLELEWTTSTRRVMNEHEHEREREREVDRGCSFPTGNKDKLKSKNTHKNNQKISV